MEKFIKIILAPILLFCILISINKSIIISFICIIVHELSHIIVAKCFGSKFNNFEVHIFGARVELMELDELSDKEKLLIYIAGPAMNLFIFIIFYLISINYDDSIFKVVRDVNLGLALFNLLPAYPLDGSRILEIILSKRIIYKKVSKIIAANSYLVAAFFILISIIAPIFTHKYNITLTVAGIIIIYITIKENETKMYIIMGNIFKKRKYLIKNKYLENRCISVYSKQGLVNLMALVDKNRFNTFYILDDDMKILFIMHEDELIEALKLYGNITVEEYYKKR